MHQIAVVALPNSVASDIATPIDVFGRVQLLDGRAGYEVRVCGTAPEVSVGPMRIATDHRLDELGSVDTIVVPGCHDPLGGRPKS